MCLVLAVVTSGDRSAAARLFADGADFVELDGVVLGHDLDLVTHALAPGVTTDDLATMAVHAVLGVALIRTHDVQAARRVCDVVAAVRGTG